jgi:long-chain acyl-CoA synthetase
MSANGSEQYDNVAAAKTIADAFWLRAASTPEAPLYRWATASSAEATRVWHMETYASTKPKIARIAHYLKSIGVGVGTTVAIMSQTRPEWMLVDIAVQTLGGITVSMYQSLPAHEAGYLLFDSKAQIIFVENEEQAQKVAHLSKHPCAIPEHEGVAACEVQLAVSHVISFERVEALAAVMVSSIVNDASLPTEPPSIPAELSRSCVASYVYTSGTTGPPKGVVQTHGNHLTNVEQVSHAGVFLLNGSLFLYLPLAHSFARLAYYVGFLTSAHLVLPAITDHHTSKVDLASVARDIREAGASVLPSVPRLFEKMAAAIQSRAVGTSLQQKILSFCLRNAQKTYERRTKGQPLGLLEQIAYRGLAPIRAKIKAQLFGATFCHGISGGAKLDPGVNSFFDALGILICEGYGLTETCVATHVNLPNNRKIGSVGPALEKVEVRLSSEDGEIMMRGPNITQGYLHRPKATSDSWDTDGWFHTGDVGRMDEQGFLYITDRKKELVVTAGGKKIPPQSIEGLFKRHPFISQALYYGDGKPHCVMLFTLNEVELRTMLKHEGFALQPETKLSTLQAVRSLVEKAVQDANAKLASYETIKNFEILSEDFTIDNGLLTPTMKMKRKAIVARYQGTLESLYGTGH